jgi:hypothetical protein
MLQQEMMETESEMRNRLLRGIDRLQRKLDNDHSLSYLDEDDDELLEKLSVAQLELLGDMLDDVLEMFENASSAHNDVCVQLRSWCESEE